MPLQQTIKLGHYMTLECCIHLLAKTIHVYHIKNDSCLSYIEQALELINPDNPAYTGYALNYAATPGANPIKSKQFLSAIKSESLEKHITLGFLYLNNGSLDSAYKEVMIIHGQTVKTTIGIPIFHFRMLKTA